MFRSHSRNQAQRSVNKVGVPNPNLYSAKRSQDAPKLLLRRMPNADRMAMMHRSISPSDEAIRRRVENGYVRNNERGDESYARSRDSTGRAPNASNNAQQRPRSDLRRATEQASAPAAQSAQHRTLQYYQKTSQEGQPMGVSMHTHFPDGSQSAIGRGHAGLTPRRGGPPLMIGAEPDEASRREMQRRQKESSGMQRRPETDSRESPSGGISMGSRSERSRNPQRSLVPRRTIAGNNSPVSRRTIGINSQQEPERQRRLPSSSTSHTTLPPPPTQPHRTSNSTRSSRTCASAPQSRRPMEHNSNTTRSSRTSGSSSSRQSLDQSKLEFSRAAAPVRVNRRSNSDLDDVDDRQLGRIDEDQNEFARRRQRQLMIPKKSNSQPSQRSLGRERSQRSLDSQHSADNSQRSQRPPDIGRSTDNDRSFEANLRRTNPSADRPRRMTSSETDRPRLKTSDPDNGDSFDRPRRSRNNNGGKGDSHRPRRPNSNGDNDTHDRSRRKQSIDGDATKERSTRSRHNLASENGFPTDTHESRASSNPFADAMKAILMDTPLSGFTTEKEMEQRIADLVLGKLKNASIGSAVKRGGDHNSDPGFSFQPDPVSPSAGPPQNNATIVLTDVQGSTSLWESNPQAMQEALDIHDKILRRFCAFHNGYEIDTEGDAFFLAFHNPMDAFGFALDTQSALYDTQWSKEILEIPAAFEEGSFSGLRVRMGIHKGPVSSCKNAVTGRTEYVGDAMNIAKCVEGMTHGGQILTTFETWNIASYKAEADLGSPQVVDLGCHMLNPKGSDAPLARRIIQLVPASLSYDYFAARRLKNDNTNAPRMPPSRGRQFDPPITDEQVSASFNDAPHEHNEATIAFVYFSEIENHYEDPKAVVAALIRLIGDLLVGTPGYHSQSNMLAFPNVNEAVKFGLRLMEELKVTRLADDYADVSKMIKLGCVHDTFLTMGPHKTTGRADYFGKVVNRAARITAKSELGTVNFGVLADESVANLPNLDGSIICELKGVKQLKGVQEDMALYECSMDFRFAPLGLQR